MTVVHDRPDPAGLIEAVREFLDHPPHDPDRERLHRRIASNVLALAGRELASASADRQTHRARLTALGVRDNVELADLAGRIDEHDDRFPALTEALADWSRAKIAVVNPRYLEDGVRT